MTTLDTAPAEVLHAVCALLPPKAVARLRLTCNVLAEIGAHYLVRQVKFHTSDASLGRLQKIANHKVFSQYIETVYFEANLLRNICCPSAWEEYLQTRGAHGIQNSKLEMPKEPQSPKTARTQRIYVRNLVKWQKLVASKYDEYRSLFEVQQELYQRGPELMADIMPRFPRLKEVIFAIGRCQHVLSSRFVKEFDTDLGYGAPLSIDTAPTGTQLKHLIAPGGHPLHNLQTLIVSDLDPSLFKIIETCPLMVRAFVNLKKLDISFRLPSKDEPTTEPGLYAVLKTGALRDAICSADQLEQLRIAFSDYTYDGPCVELKNILGEKSFEKLTTLSLSYVEANAKDFIEILKRQRALEHLDVSFVSINGSWVDVLEKLKELDLKGADFAGFLSDDEQMYNMDYAQVDHYMDCAEELSIASAMELYITDCDDDYPNPLESFEDEYSDLDTLIEMYHEMRAEMSDDDCDCEACLAECYGLDDDDNSMLDLDDDSMPDLEGTDGSSAD